MRIALIRRVRWAPAASLVASLAQCVPRQYATDDLTVIVAPWVGHAADATAAVLAGLAFACLAWPTRIGTGLRLGAALACLVVFPLTLLMSQLGGATDWRRCGEGVEHGGHVYRLLRYAFWQDRDLALARDVGSTPFSDTVRILTTLESDQAAYVAAPIRPDGPTGPCGRVYATPAGRLIGVTDPGMPRALGRAIGYDPAADRPSPGDDPFALIGDGTPMRPGDVSTYLELALRTAPTDAARSSIERARTHPDPEVRRLAERLLAPR